MALHAHESAIIEAFFLPQRRARYCQLLGHPKMRKKALDTLNHAPPIDRRYATPLGSEEVEEALRKHGAPVTCYVMSDIPEIDGREMDLEIALHEAEHGCWGTIIGCIPGKLAVYLAEAGEKRLLLYRPG